MTARGRPVHQPAETQAVAEAVQRVDHARPPPRTRACARHRRAARLRASAVSCSEGARRTIESSSVDAARPPGPRRARCTSIGRCRPAVALRQRPACTATAARRGASRRRPARPAVDSKSKPGRPSRLPSTRSTFQAGRVSPSGLTTRVEALHAAFGVDEGARRLGERRDRQQHVAEFEVGLERAQGDDHLRLRQAASRGRAPAAESNTGSVLSSSAAFRPAEHLAGVQAAFAGSAPTSCAPDVLAASLR